jgi:ABC-2 type transport system ATP-binding protein
MSGDASPPPAMSDPTRDAAVTIQGLRVRYGEVDAIAGLDLEILRGSVVALLGPNGAGKSSMINCTIGLKRPAEGHVMVAGTDPREAVRQGAVGAMLQVSASHLEPPCETSSSSRARSNDGADLR